MAVDHQAQAAIDKTLAERLLVERLLAYRRVKELASHDLSGFILKKDSPSCGMERVKIYPEAGGMPNSEGSNETGDKKPPRLQ